MNPKRVQPVTGSQVKTRDQQCMTADIFFADAETSTKSKKAEASIQTENLKGAQFTD